MSFSSVVSRWCGRTAPEATVRMLRGTSIALFAGVIRDTPVDTGRLRSNWRCSIGEANREEQTSTDKQGTIAVVEMMGKAAVLEGDQTIIICNSLPYAARIEYEGWSSKKAPEGMVRKNFARVHQLLAKELRSVRS